MSFELKGIFTLIQYEFYKSIFVEKNDINIKHDNKMKTSLVNQEEIVFFILSKPTKKKIVVFLNFFVIATQLIAQIDFQRQHNTLIVQDQTNIIIENLKWDGFYGNCIILRNCHNVTIRNCYFANTVTEAETEKIQELAIATNYNGFAIGDLFRKSGGYSDGRIAIRADPHFPCSNITIENCYFERVETAIYLQIAEGPILIRNNECKNIQGPGARGQFVQLNACFGSEIIVEKNYIHCDQEKTFQEDAINFFRTQGTPNSYATIRNNYIYGAGLSTSGAAINLADGGFPAEYNAAYGNVCIESNGIGIAGGRYCILEGNILYNSGTKRSNVGLVVANFYSTTGICYGHKVKRNRINWRNNNGIFNPVWFGADAFPSCSDNEVFGNNWRDITINSSFPKPEGVGIITWHGPLTGSSNYEQKE